MNKKTKNKGLVNETIYRIESWNDNSKSNYGQRWQSTLARSETEKKARKDLYEYKKEANQKGVDREFRIVCRDVCERVLLT